MVDCFGTELKVGDFIAAATLNNKYHHLRIGIVTSVSPDGVGMKWDLIGPNLYRYSSVRRNSTYLWNSSRIVKLDPGAISPELYATLIPFVVK